MKFKITTIIVFLIALSHNIFAQGNSGLETSFYQSGKIYVVVAVVAIILIGIFGYLFYLDRKLNKLEKNS